MTEATSLSLLERAKTDPTSTGWQMFFDLYSQLIDGWLRRRGLQAQDIDDVRQEVMTLVIRELPGFEHNGRTGAFRNWLRTVTANRLRQFWRDKMRKHDAAARQEYVELADQLEDPNSQLSRIWNQEHDQFVLGQLLRQAKVDFSPNTVAAFERVAIDGQGAAEVAEALGMSINAVRIAQSRVLRSLRKLAEGLV